MKFFQQTEATECGLASLAMIATHFGHDVDLRALRSKFPVSLKGASLRSLLNIADQLNLTSRPIKIEAEDIASLKLPAILHWDMDHFVVIEKVEKKYIDILDPAKGKRRLKFSEFSRFFTGVAIEFSKTNDFSALSLRTKIKISDLWGSIDGVTHSLFQVLLLTLFFQIFALTTPLFLQIIIDEAIVRADFTFLTIITLGFLSIYVLMHLTTAVRSWVITVLGQSALYQMSSNVIRHLFRLPMTYFEKRHIGDVLSRTNSIGAVERAVTQNFISAIIDGVMILFTLVIMFIYSWELTVIAIVFAILKVFSTLAFFPHIMRRKEEYIDATAKVNSLLIETIRALRAIKLYGKESERDIKWRNGYTVAVNKSLKENKLVILEAFFANISTALQIVFVIYLGALAILKNEMTVGVLVAFLAYQSNFNSSLDALRRVLLEFKMLGLHLDRLSDIVKTKGEKLSYNPSMLNNKIQGLIELSDIYFRYSPSENFVLKNINLRIQPGSFVVIKGPSGDGKTTLFKIILGLHDFEKGSLKIDGKTLTQIGVKNYRDQIGVVTQSDTLLSGTIADNISFFDTEIDMDKVKRSAHLASIDDEIENMPMKYFSLIGDMGTALSGGQQQRIMIARAFYRDPAIFFLDEGTANLDKASEDAVALSLKELPATKIVVTHNPNMQQYADAVYELVGGNLSQVR